MKRIFFADSHTALDAAYEYEGDGSPRGMFAQIRIWLHLLVCPACAKELKDLRAVREVMKTDFLPAAPDFEEILMKRLAEETGREEKTDAPAGFSFRGWVITGFFVLVSLSSSFFGARFTQIPDEEGLSLLLPLGLTTGAIVTCYGALFIASHLKELSARFRLH